MKVKIILIYDLAFTLWRLSLISAEEDSTIITNCHAFAERMKDV